jgi:hypothetical protein
MGYNFYTLRMSCLMDCLCLLGFLVIGQLNNVTDDDGFGPSSSILPLEKLKTDSPMLAVVILEELPSKEKSKV